MSEWGLLTIRMRHNMFTTCKSFSVFLPSPFCYYAFLLFKCVVFSYLRYVWMDCTPHINARSQAQAQANTHTQIHLRTHRSTHTRNNGHIKAHFHKHKFKLHFPLFSSLPSSAIHKQQTRDTHTHTHTQIIKGGRYNNQPSLN